MEHQTDWLWWVWWVLVIILSDQRCHLKTHQQTIKGWKNPKQASTHPFSSHCSGFRRCFTYMTQTQELLVMSYIKRYTVGDFLASKLFMNASSTDAFCPSTPRKKSRSECAFGALSLFKLLFACFQSRLLCVSLQDYWAFNCQFLCLAIHVHKT